MINLTMVPEMPMGEIKRAIIGVNQSPRFVLVCCGTEWYIFLAASSRCYGSELEVDFWHHDDNNMGGSSLFHQTNDLKDGYSVYTSDIRAIFDDRDKAIAVARSLKAASEKFEHDIRAPAVAYQLSLLMAIA